MSYEAIRRRAFEQNVLLEGREKICQENCLEHKIHLLKLIAPELLNKPPRTYNDAIEQFELVSVDREAKEDCIFGNEG